VHQQIKYTIITFFKRRELLSYTLIFGNNFILGSPKCIKIYDIVLFYLGKNELGPHLSTVIQDSLGTTLVRVDNNRCTYCQEKLNNKSNEPEHILITNAQGENILESRVLDKNTILVGGMFGVQQFMLVATQNYIVMPSGKKFMHGRIDAHNSDIILTEDRMELG